MMSRAHTQRLFKTRAGTLATAILLACAAPASAAVLYVETFTGSAPASYTGRDGEFSTVGYSGANTFEGSFGAQGVPTPQTDAIRITDGTFLDNYLASYAPTYDTFWWTFDFYVDDVLPSDFNIVMGNGSGAFYYTGAHSLSLGMNNLSINLNSASWIGGPGSYTSYDLSSMTYIDIQYSRNGTSAQQFYLDNFALNGNLDNGGGGGGGDGAVPEPNTLIVVSIAGAILLSIRKRLKLANA